jgi:hypothetical protein
VADSARIERLRDAYGAILERYRELERLSRRELRTLREQGEIAKVNALLREKKSILREIRAEEERVTGEREWWKKSRRSLPPASCRDLLSLLDAISRAIESTVALEADCRALLQDALRPAAVPRLTAGPRTAALAYSRGAGAGGEA